MSAKDENIQNQDPVIGLASEIVAAYVANNPVQSSELPELIRKVHESLTKLSVGESGDEEIKPAVPVRKSITDEYLVCLEDGKKFKSLKRHLRAKYGMSPEEYREKWNLPYDYPMVAPAYARQRSDLAKRMGLGQGRKENRE